jgi:Zn-dependent protease with chaperone function
MSKAQRIAVGLIVWTLGLGGCSSVNRPDAKSAEVKAEQQRQMQTALPRQLQYQQRLDNLGIPFEEKSAAWCGKDVVASLGVRIASVWSYPEEQRNAARSSLGLDERLKVLWRVEGSAARSDLQAGDILLSVNGQPLARTEEGAKALEAVLGKKPANLELQVLRGDQTRRVAALLTPRCSYALVAELDATVNAYTDGSRIVFYSGIMNLFPQERDLAIIFGHELAHDVRSHISKGIAANVLGASVDLLLGGLGAVDDLVSAPFSRRFEAEADYTGLYLTANAGYDINGAEQVWREMGINLPGSTTKGMTDSHPTSPERYVALRRTVAEIQAKQKSGQPLKP